MKRQTAMALAAVFAMSVAGTALAAPANPFSDVPAKHWSYDSVNKLAQAGVISGYGDGTFKGDKTLTRYEMATIVAKAMANADKADAETLKTIEALKAEYGTELSNLGVRVDNLEKNASKVKFTGEIRERYEDSEDATTADKTTSKTRVRITMTAPIADNVTFKGRIHSESEWGQSGTASLDQAYITGKLGDVTYNFGRQPILIGQKILGFNSQNNDGIVLSAGKDIRVTAGAFKNNNGKSSTPPATPTFIEGNFVVGNIDFKLNKDLHITASYLADDNDGVATVTSSGNAYKDTAVGFLYTGLKNFTLTGEAAQNDSDATKAVSTDGDKAKAWASRIKYLGANPSKVHSYGLYVSYRKAEKGFDTTPNNWNDFSDMANWNGIKEMDDIKGLDYGFEYTLFKNGVMRVQYNDMESYNGATDKKNMFAELVYTF